MNRVQLNIASDCLRAIKDNDGDTRHPAGGICAAISKYMTLTLETWDNHDLIYNTLRDMMVEWPDGTGCRSFPVPDPNDNDFNASSVVFLSTDDYWSGPYGELRLKLLDWLIDKVETSLTDLKAK